MVVQRTCGNMFKECFMLRREDLCGSGESAARTEPGPPRAGARGYMGVETGDR